MAVGLWRVTWGLGLAEPYDPSVNDFTIELPDGFGSTEITAITAAIRDFYFTAAGGVAHPVAYYTQASYFASDPLVEVFDISTHLDGSSHGSPVAMPVLSSPGVVPIQGLPGNLSAVLAVRADYGLLTEFDSAVDASIPTGDRAVDEGAPSVHSGHDRPRSRVRGRLHIGPLNTNALQVVTAQPAFVQLTFAQSLCQAAKALQTAIEAITPTVTEWGVWSRRNAAVQPIRHAEVRTTFGVSRRRVDQGGVLNAVDF